MKRQGFMISIFRFDKIICKIINAKIITTTKPDLDAFLIKYPKINLISFSDFCYRYFTQILTKIK